MLIIHLIIYIYIYIYGVTLNISYILFHTYVYIVYIFIWWSLFIPSRDLDEVFTYNHMILMSLRSRYHVKASMVLTREIYIYICIYLSYYTNYNNSSKSLGSIHFIYECIKHRFSINSN